MYLVVGLGQVIQVARIVGGVERIVLWSSIIGNAVLVLSEVVLPLSALFASTLVFARWRSDGSALGLLASGLRPSSLIMPVVITAALVSCLVVTLAHSVVPSAIQRIGDVVTSASAQGLFQDSFQAGQVQLVRIPSGGAKDVIWAVVDGEDQPATLIRSEEVSFQGQRAGVLSSRGLQVWGPDYSLKVKQARFSLDAEDVAKRLRMFGPPNALSTLELDSSQAHHVFTLHRRFGVPLMMIPWTLLGAALGISLGGVLATIGGVAMAGGGYWLLRVGELAARRGDLSPALAGWAPFAVTCLLALLAVYVIDRRGLRETSVGL